MKILKDNQFFAKLYKCEFLLRSIVFHAHIISSEWREVDTREMEVVKSWPKHLSLTDI